MLGILNDTLIGKGEQDATRGWASQVHWSREFLSSIVNRDQYLEEERQKIKLEKDPEVKAKMLESFKRKKKAFNIIQRRHPLFSNISDA